MTVETPRKRGTGGGARAGAGRPPKADRVRALSVRLSPSHVDLLEQLCSQLEPGKRLTQREVLERALEALERTAPPRALVV